MDADEVSLFNVSLLNGGQVYIQEIFEREAACVTDLKDVSKLRAVKKKIIKRIGSRIVLPDIQH